MADDDETTTLPVSPLRITVRPLRSRLEQELELADQQSSNPLPTYQPLALPVERPDYLMPQQTIPGQPTPFAQQAIRDSWPVRMVGSGITLPADVVAGKVDPVSDEGITRSVDLAGLGSVGPMAMAKAGTGVIPALPAFFKKGLPLEERMAEWVQMQKQNMQNSPTLMSDSGTPGSGIAAVANSQHAPAFYSAVEQTVKNAKMQKGTADQWIGYLRNQAGVKPEELQWTGLNELPAGQISKADLEKYIAENKVQIGEVTKGDVDHYQLQYKEALPRKLTEFKNILNEFASPSDVATAKKVNTQFRETVKGKTDQEVFNAIQEAKSLPNHYNLFKNYDTKAEAEAAIKAAGAEEHIGEPIKRIEHKETKYSSYQLPGGENYKETLLTLPSKLNENRINEISKILDNKTYKNQDEFMNLVNERLRLQGKDMNNQNLNYKSSHWDEPNVLAHIRTNDRMIDGKKTLHIEEIQSDWGQSIRKQGYKGEASQLIDKQNKGTISAAEEKRLNEIIQHGTSGGLPDMPFKKTWDELALKNIIHKAAEGGYDAISWTPGEAQAARYDLSKHVKEIEYIKNHDGTYKLGVIGKNGDGIDIPNSDKMSLQQIENTIGKEMAEKIKNEDGKQYRGHEGKTLEGLDLKVGGEGMKVFYDKMLVDKASNLSKKLGGGKIETKEIGYGGNKYGNKYGWEKGDDGKYYVTAFDGEKNIRTGEAYSTREQAQHQMKSLMQDAAKQSVHYLPITASMREHALSRGFPLFSSGLSVITPVQHDPWKITPINYNPFLNPNAT